MDQDVDVNWANQHFCGCEGGTLFMRLALSTVILRPMLQLGCLIASATVTVLSFSTGHSRKAPPLAVRMMRRSPPGGNPWHRSPSHVPRRRSRGWEPLCAVAETPESGNNVMMLVYSLATIPVLAVSP